MPGSGEGTRWGEGPGFGLVPADADLSAPTGDTVHLLPAFDPYVVGSLRQLDVVSTGERSAVSRPQGWVSPTLVVDGRIEGTWEPDPRTSEPLVTAFRELPSEVWTAVERRRALYRTPPTV